MAKLNVRANISLLLPGFCTAKEARKLALDFYKAADASPDRISELSEVMLRRRGVSILFDRLFTDSRIDLGGLVEKYGGNILNAEAAPTHETLRDCRGKPRKRPDA